MKNPWINLPADAPFIAPIDKPFIDARIDDLLHLKFEIPPDPYLGNLDKAKIVLLALNPGFEDGDIFTFSQPEYARQNRLSLLHDSNPSFYALNKELSYSGAYRWWTRVLKKPLEITSLSDLGQKLMCVQYFPYHSVSYSHFSPVLPTQEYSFSIVKEAIRQQKLIIVMRSEKLWLKAVPELKSVNYIKIKNPRNPVLSPNNMSNSEYQRVIEALR